MCITNIILTELFKLNFKELHTSIQRGKLSMDYPFFNSYLMNKSFCMILKIKLKNANLV